MVSNKVKTFFLLAVFNVIPYIQMHNPILSHHGFFPPENRLFASEPLFNVL